jgi:hypothetical protein
VALGTTSDSVIDLAVNRPVNTTRQGPKLLVPVELKPYSFATYRMDDPRAKVESCSNEPLDEKHLAHMHRIIEKTAKLVGDPKAREALSNDELDFIQETLSLAKAKLVEGEYAIAWSKLTYWRFWSLLRDKLKG